METARHLDMSVLGPLINSLMALGLFVLGLLWKMSVGRFDKRIESMEAAFSERQKTLIGHFDKLVEVQGNRLNAMDDRFSALSREMLSCRAEHDRNAVRAQDVAEIKAQLAQIFERLSELDRSVAAHHATRHPPAGTMI